MDEENSCGGGGGEGLGARRDTPSLFDIELVYRPGCYIENRISFTSVEYRRRLLRRLFLSVSLSCFPSVKKWRGMPGVFISDKTF